MLNFLHPLLVVFVSRGIKSPNLPTLTVLGGSNTCGHGRSVPTKKLFRNVLFGKFMQLHKTARQPIHTSARLQNSCTPSMGPQYAASCFRYFVPNTTTMATVEFTPNLLFQSIDGLRDLSLVVQRLLELQIVTLLINLVPPGKGYREIGLAVTGIGRKYRVPVITLEWSRSTQQMWLQDKRHLNEMGHQFVANATFDHIVNSLWAPSLSNVSTVDMVAPGIGLPSCIFGNDLENIKLPLSQGFALKNDGARVDAPKTGLLATQPNASLRLCLNHSLMHAPLGNTSTDHRGRKPLKVQASPRGDLVAALSMERSGWLPMSNVSFVCDVRYCSCPPQRLGPGNEFMTTALYIGKMKERATHAYIHRIFINMTKEGRGNEACGCVMIMENTKLPNSESPRAKILGIVLSGSKGAAFANRFHMGINPSLITG